MGGEKKIMSVHNLRSFAAKEDRKNRVIVIGVYGVMNHFLSRDILQNECLI